jgi:hypothetical protein
MMWPTCYQRAAASTFNVYKAVVTCVILLPTLNSPFAVLRCLLSLQLLWCAGVPVQWDAYFSQVGASVGQPSLRAIVNRFSGVPGAIGLHAGLPAAEAFPITSMHCTLRDGTQVTIDNPETVRLPVSAALNACSCCSTALVETLPLTNV